MRQSSHGQLHAESGPGRSCPKAPEGPPLSQSEAPTLSVCPEGLAGACHTVVLKPGCRKSEGAVGLYGSGPLRPRHLEPLCDTEKGTPSSKWTQPASVPSAGHQPHPPTVALNGRGCVSGGRRVQEGWRRLSRLALGWGWTVFTCCLSLSPGSKPHGGTAHPSECWAHSRCQISILVN